MTGPDGSAVVKVENLHKRFGELEVLRGINMEVDQGEVVVIFGRSGSGKSTLLRCINFLEDPTEGTVEVSGIRLEGGHRTRGKREQIRLLRLHAGMVFQQFNLFPHLTVINNVMEGPVTVKGLSLQLHGSARTGDEVVFCVRPENITIISDQGGATSARNVIPAVINKIVSMGAYYKLHLDCGIPLVASLTLQSLSELNLQKGQRVNASFKATSVHLIRAVSQ